MNWIQVIGKIRRRIWFEIVSFSSVYKLYPLFYRCSWHAYFYTQNKKEYKNFLTAIPNPGAGIGHQIANWTAGYWFAKQFELNFAHIPFPSINWEVFLGFGAEEVYCNELIEQQGYKKVRLPLFKENNAKDIAQIKRIITSYSDEKVVFVCEQDQFYRNQFEVKNIIKNKFKNATVNLKNNLIFDSNFYNIAIHLRRGDIVVTKDTKKPNLLMRWQDETYFSKVLTSVVKNIQTEKPLAIFLFSQGNPNDFTAFKGFENIKYCFDMDAQNSFMHMAYADVLITSKSSFSYKPALLSDGIKICPANFWHGYPNTKDWVIVDDQGKFNLSVFDIIKSKKNVLN